MPNPIMLLQRCCPSENEKLTAVVFKTAFQTIYARGALSIPKLLQADDGKEFKGAVNKYFKEQNVMIRQEKPNRHRQQAVVERCNATIARAVFTTLHAKEIETNETQTVWVDNLSTIIQEINARTLKNKKIMEEKRAKMDPSLRCDGDSCNLLTVGTLVYVISDQPTEIPGIKLKGKNLVTDLRWDPTPRTVQNIILRPYQIHSTKSQA